MANFPTRSLHGTVLSWGNKIPYKDILLSPFLLFHVHESLILSHYNQKSTRFSETDNKEKMMMSNVTNVSVISTNGSVISHDPIQQSKAIDVYYDSGLVLLICLGLPANFLIGFVASRFLRKPQLQLNTISKTFHVLVIWNVVTNGLATAWTGFVVAARHDVINLKARSTCNAFGFFSSWLSMVTVWLPFVTSLSRYNIAMGTTNGRINPWSVGKINLLSVLMTIAMAIFGVIPFTSAVSYHLTRLHGCTAKTNSMDFNYRILTNVLRILPCLLTVLVYGAIFFHYRKLRNQVGLENELEQKPHVLALWKNSNAEKRLSLLMFATVMHLTATALLGAVLLNFHNVSGAGETGCLLKNTYHVITPFIIGLSSGRYRRETQKIIRHMVNYE